MKIGEKLLLKGIFFVIILNQVKELNPTLKLLETICPLFVANVLHFFIVATLIANIFTVSLIKYDIQ